MTLLIRVYLNYYRQNVKKLNNVKRPIILELKCL